MSTYNKRHDDKLAKNTNLSIKIIGGLIIIIMSLIGFGVNVSVDIAKQVGIDIRTIRNTVSEIQQENRLNAQSILINKEKIKQHQVADSKKFYEITEQLNKLKSSIK